LGLAAPPRRAQNRRAASPEAPPLDPDAA